ncbi:bifunctional DNA primase/polymerase [Nocardioides mangrovicus]|uniref:bifunctional DNA primase/polymerase n=1 Tax=Nocardioides mangrovicus TaxID=2478913 RepID=UPI0011C425AA|nr:bifunctional DNA primase/polymerase [Nocardioides mangrovicus]
MKGVVDSWNSTRARDGTYAEALHLELLAGALRLARLGFRVHPCAPGGKAPMLRDWPRRASSDAYTITAWWDRYRMANVAVVTGAPGPDVLDVDVRPGGNGFDALEVLRSHGLLAGATAVVDTPSGGQHLYFAGTGRRTSSPAGRFLDYKATGGYVLVPPSQIWSGDDLVGGYRFRAELTGLDTALDWPAALDLLRPPPQPRPAAKPGTRSFGRRVSLWQLAASVRSARAGERNNILFRAGCAARRHGLDLETLREPAREAGLSEAEIDQTLDSAKRMVDRERGA